MTACKKLGNFRPQLKHDASQFNISACGEVPCRLHRCTRIKELHKRRQQCIYSYILITPCCSSPSSFSLTTASLTDSLSKLCFHLFQFHSFASYPMILFTFVYFSLPLPPPCWLSHSRFGASPRKYHPVYTHRTTVSSIPRVIRKKSQINVTLSQPTSHTTTTTGTRRKSSTTTTTYKTSATTYSSTYADVAKRQRRSVPVVNLPPAPPRQQRHSTTTRTVEGGYMRPTFASKRRSTTCSAGTAVVCECHSCSSHLDSMQQSLQVQDSRLQRVPSTTDLSQVVSPVAAYIHENRPINPGGVRSRTASPQPPNRGDRRSADLPG